MRSKTIALLLLLTSGVTFSQSTPCTVSNASAKLDVNNVEAILQASGDIWWDRSDAGYFVPKPTIGQPATASIYAGGMWLSGFDPGGNLKVAASGYGAATGLTDWWPGPIDAESGATVQEICQNFDRHWKVNRSEIEQHRADFLDNGQIDGPVPASVLAWPGRNNPESPAANGFALPTDHRLAPFFDQNANGNYEPMLGDYPEVPGDQAIWWVFNDEGGGALHGETQGVAIRAEVLALAYAFAGETDANLYNTTFYDFTIINQAKEFIDSTFVSLWMDVDLGCYTDDFLGSIPEEKLAFFYNADALDGDVGCNCSGNVPTYCENAPLLGVKVLSGPESEAGEDLGFSSFMYLNNPGVGSSQPATHNPNSDIEYYRFMSGSWRDGTPLTAGGDGYDPASTDFTSHVFAGNPSDPNGWSECTENLLVGDKRVVINSGPFKLEPGESTSVCYAVMSYFGATLPCPDVTPLVEMGDAVAAFCNSMTGADDTPIRQHGELVFLPNPVHGTARLVLKNAEQGLQQVSIFGLDGRLVQFFNNLNTNELEISAQGWAAGVYSYLAVLKGGFSLQGKFVVQD